MSEQEFNKIFAANLRFYLEEHNMTQAELAQRLNVSAQSVTNWCKAVKSPRMDKVDAMCTIFNCRRSDLMEHKTLEERNSYTAYYLNDETREIAQEIFENKELRSLFDVARDLSPERLKAHVDFIKSLKAQETNNDNEGC